MGPLAPIPYEWLGAFALLVLWTNVLLTAAAAMQQRAWLGALRSRLVEARRSGALHSGVVEQVGASGALAVRRVNQVGRAMTVSGPDRILFTDRDAHAEVLGGTVLADGGERVELAPRAQNVELWLAPGAAVSRAPSFDAAWSRASTNKGLEATVEQRIGEGERVWIHRDGEVLRIATVDPIADCTRKRALLAGFAVATVAACAVATVVACWPPVFGTVSTLGGVLCVACFLGIPPIGTAARDAARTPPERALNGTWQRPTA